MQLIKPKHIKAPSPFKRRPQRNKICNSFSWKISARGDWRNGRGLLRQGRLLLTRGAEKLPAATDGFSQLSPALPNTSLNTNTSLLSQYQYLPQYRYLPLPRYQYLPPLHYIFTSSSLFQHHLNPFPNLPICYLITQSSDLCMESIQKGYFSLLLLIFSLFLISLYVKRDMTPCVFFKVCTVYTGLGPI